MGFLLASLGLAGPASAGDGSIGYAQATGYFKKDTRPTLYQPLNLLDGRDNTAWCSPTGDPLNELLSFGATAPVKIDELKITTGNNFDSTTFNEFARAKKVVLKAGKQTRTLKLEDVRGPQTLAVTPPLEGTRFTLEVLDSYAPDDPDAPVCLTDVIFSASGRALSGNWMTTRLKYDKQIDAVLGPWFAGFDKTPDRFLVFNFDGTFRYSFEPYDTVRAKPEALEGTYDISAARVTFTVGGKRSAAKWSREPGKKGLSLTFDGDLPEQLKQAFRSVP